MRDLTSFELRKVLLSVDRKTADMFYAHGIDGETFVSLTSEQVRRYGCPLNPYRLATLKKEAKVRSFRFNISLILMVFNFFFLHRERSRLKTIRNLAFQTQT
eukprot:UN27216